MFHFLKVVKKDLEHAAGNVAHAADNAQHAAGNVVHAATVAPKKTLSFLGDAAQTAGDTVQAVVEHPIPVAKAVASDVAKPFIETGKAVTSLPAAIGREIQNKPIDDIQKNVFGTNNPGDIAKKVGGDLAQIGSYAVGGGEAKAALDAAKATKAAKEISTVEKLKEALSTSAKVGKEGAAITAVNSGGAQLSNEGHIDASQTLKDALVGGLLTGGGSAAVSAGKAAPKAAKALEEHITDAAAQHPVVLQLNEHLQQLNQQRQSLVARGAPEATIQLNNKAYTSALKARNDAVKAIKEGGFVGKNDNPGGAGSFVEALAPSKNQKLDDMEAAGAKVATQKSVPTTPGYTPPKTGAEFAQALLSDGTGGKVKLDSAVVDLLGKTGKAVDSASKAPVLEGARDPQSVLGRHFGREGSDIAYDASVGAKKRSDLQSAADPLINDAEKALKKAAKTKAGQADVESRINSALEDRTNADTYLKTPEEKAAYEATKKFYDHYQGHIEAAGKGTLENYSPRVARQNAEEASQGLDYTVSQAFSKDTSAPFLKERTKTEPDQQLLEKPVSTMRNYSSSVSKQLAFEDMMKKLPERLQKVNPIYTIDQATKQKGKAYLQKYMKDLLQPDIPTSGKGLGKVISEKSQNKLINRTYSAALTLSPKFGLMNRTQGYATRSQVSKEARKLAGKIDKKDLQELRGSLTSGDNPISGEAGNTASSVGGSKTKMEKVQAVVSGERANVNHAFDAGVAQHLVDSPIYKTAIKDGKKPQEAAKLALADPATKNLAIRAGNVLTNTTQFGGNIANKPEWLRESGTILGLSKKWYQQYQRFPLGMTQLLGNVTNPKRARALDIMRRGDPKQTKLVDYLKAAKTLQNALPDAQKAVKAGETTVTKQQLKESKKLLDKSVKILDAEIKKNSKIRGGKTVANVGKMWAAASVIQYLFAGATGTNKDKTTDQKLAQAAKFGAPVNIPTKNQNPLNPIPASSPITAHGVSGRKLLNFIPVVGPVVNRGREAAGFISALTGSNQ